MIYLRELEKVTLDELVDKTLSCSHIIGYTDLGDSSDVRGQWLAALSDENVRCLAMGAVIIQQARDAVKEKTGFTCSAGIACNKVNIRDILGNNYTSFHSSHNRIFSHRSCKKPESKTVYQAVFIKLHQVCENKTSCNVIFEDLYKKPSIKSLDNQVASSLLTTCSKLVIVKPDQSM